MYKVEFIFKESVLKDSLRNWRLMGKTTENNESGGFVFECEEHPLVQDSYIWIAVDDSRYLYNLADFYRIKITYTGDE
jgi:hypothetical protein